MHTSDATKCDDVTALRAGNKRRDFIDGSPHRTLEHDVEINVSFRAAKDRRGRTFSAFIACFYLHIARTGRTDVEVSKNCPGQWTLSGQSETVTGRTDLRSPTLSGGLCTVQ